uniref:L1 transposable element RRM domain-containing protein n=1 Tax=Amphilophus citrinellus TaxID=61819 RepID=A0A3Q0QNI2_AMPCI
YRETMANKGGKGRQTTSARPRPDAPSASSTSSGKRDSDVDVPTGPLDIEGIKRDLLLSLRADFVSMMKTEVRAVLESEMAVIQTEVRAMRAGFEDFKTAMKTDLTSLRSTLGDAERSLTACSDDIELLKREVKRLGALTDSLPDPEEIISGSLVFQRAPTAEALDLADSPLIDRSHRSLQPVPKTGQRPRTIIARLHYYSDCVKILRLAREKQRLKVNGMIISIFPDYTARVAKARAAFNAIKQQLRGLDGVRFGISHPARLHITYNGKENFFSSPEEAQSYVSQFITPYAAGGPVTS